MRPQFLHCALTRSLQDTVQGKTRSVMNQTSRWYVLYRICFEMKLGDSIWNYYYYTVKQIFTTSLPTRIYCPRNCLQENPHLSRVIGTKIYSDVSFLFVFFKIKLKARRLLPLQRPHFDFKFVLQKSSICRSAIHAGVLRNESGGYIDVMPTDNRKLYISSYQNGIVSER